jgi:glycosyltransferase involved in cell wall biosynthesis
MPAFAMLSLFRTSLKMRDSMTENATTEPVAAAAAGTVAVIIPVYNGESFIRRALDSVRRQTYAPAEIFVVDDGSMDKTLEILQEEYGDIVTLMNQSRGGPAKARNAAMRAAGSEFLAYLDADDWWEPEKLERQVATLREHPEAVLNFTSCRTVRESDGFVG